MRSIQGQPRPGRLVAALLLPCLFAAEAAAEQGDPSDAAGLGGLRLSADRLDLDLEAGTVEAEGVRFSSCGGCVSPYTISARRASLRASGDLDLVGPVLRLGPVPVLWLPWLRLRTARRPGLLIPRLGWRSGVGLELGQDLWLPLGPRAELVVGASYLSGLAGAEVAASLGSDRWEIEARGQLGREGYGARLEGRGSARRGSTVVAAELDWTLAPELERRMAMDIAGEARTYERTALAVTSATHHVQTGLTTWLAHDLAEGSDLGADQDWLWSLSLDLLPRRLGPFWVDVHGSTRVRAPFLGSGERWPAWRLLVRPRIDLPLSVGPLAGGWTLATFHAGLPNDPRGRRGASRHVVATGLDLSVPLIKDVGGGRVHLLEPALRYRLVAVDTMSSPAAVEPSFDRWTWPLAGHTLWLGLRSVLREGTEGGGLTVVVGQVVGLPRLAGSAHDPRLRFSVRAGARLLELELEATLDERSWALGEALVRARVGDRGSRGIWVGWRWIGEAAKDLTGPDPEAVLPLLVPWPTGGGQFIEGIAWTELGRGFRLEAGAAMDLASRSLIQGGGGLSYRHRCGCVSASAQGWYRAGRRWPEVWITLEVGGLGVGASGAREGAGDRPLGRP